MLKQDYKVQKYILLQQLTHEADKFTVYQPIEKKYSYMDSLSQSKISQKAHLFETNSDDELIVEIQKDIFLKSQRQRKIKQIQKRLNKLKQQSEAASQTSHSQCSRSIITQAIKKNNGKEATVVIDLDAETDAETSMGVINKVNEKDEEASKATTNQIVKKYHKTEHKNEPNKAKDEKTEVTGYSYQKPYRRHKLMTKRTLELLAKKFKQVYACENHTNYKGSKVTLQELSDYFDINISYVHALYKQWQEDATFYDRIVRHDIYRRNPEKRLTLERLEHVSRLIKENPFMTLNELCVELNKIEDLKCIRDGKREQIIKSTVSRLLKLGKFRKKRVRSVPKERNTSKQLEKRYQFCAKYKWLLEKQAKIYFLDQSGFNLYMVRQKAWSRPHEEIAVNCPISKGKRFSLIAIIGEDGLAHWRIIDGNYRKFEYLDFIRELFQKLYDLKDERQHWLILDNCSIHDKEETMKLADKWNVKVMYLPAYSPQLNPIEMWFHEVKTKVRKINYSGERQLLEIMERTLKAYEDYDFSNYYHGSLKFVEKGLRKQKF